LGRGTHHKEKKKNSAENVAGKAVVEESDSFTLIHSQCQEVFCDRAQGFKSFSTPTSPRQERLFITGLALLLFYYYYDGTSISISIKASNTFRMMGHTTPPIATQRTAQNYQYYQLSINNRGLHFQEK
jgi:hypothetical protein